MKIIYTEGGSFLFENKTGVGNYHYEILKNIKDKVDFEIKVFNYQNRYKIQAKDEWLKDKVEINMKYKIILACIFPYKNFFKVDEKSVKIIDGYPFNIKGKKVGIVHDLMSLENPENYSFLSKIILYLFFYKIRKYNKIITVSETTKQKIVKFLKISSEKIEVVSPGIDLENIKKSNENIDLKKRFNIVKPFILYLGALRVNKNIDKVIELFYLYKKNKKNDLNLVIAGKKNQEYIKLKKLVEKYQLDKDVIFTDYITDEEKKELYKKAEAFLLFSSSEGFGIPLIEAMAFNVPILASDIDIFREILGKEIKLVNIDNLESEVEYLEKILLDKKYKMNLIEKYNNKLNEYDIKKSSEKFLKILSEV